MKIHDDNYIKSIFEDQIDSRGYPNFSMNHLHDQDSFRQAMDQIESTNSETKRIAMSRDAARSELIASRESLEMESATHVALLFDNGADRAKEAEADAAHTEAKKAEAEALVRAAMVGDQLARQEQALREEEILSRVAMLFTHSTSFSKFRSAKSKGDDAQTKDLAARILQQHCRHFIGKLRTAAQRRALASSRIIHFWHAYLSRKLAKAHHEKRLLLLREASAIKLQRRRRIQLSRRRVMQLKTVRDKKTEEFAAIRLQSRYRLHKSRQRVEGLKAKQQRLEDEKRTLETQHELEAASQSTAKDELTSLISADPDPTLSLDSGSQGGGEEAPGVPPAAPEEPASEEAKKKTCCCIS